MPLPPASGLKDNWKNKAKFDNRQAQDGPILGGVTDEHALSVRPQFDKRKPGKVSVQVLLYVNAATAVTAQHLSNLINVI